MTDPTETRSPLVSHVSVGVSDLSRAARFYDAVMHPLGARRIMEHRAGVAWGRAFPEFWAAHPHDGHDAASGNGVHICLNADSPEAVARFHAAGLAAGGFDDGPPGFRPEYAPGYYAAFLRDPDGNKIEALCWILGRRARLTAPLIVWVVSDGRAGIQNQALGLAEAVARLTPAEIAVQTVRWRPAFDRLPSAFKTPAMLAPGSLDPRTVTDWPDLWIAAGRATLPLSARARDWSGGKTFVVQTQDPRWNNAAYDLIVAPAHDGLSGPNVLSITGSPHRITPERLAQAAPAFADRIAPLPRPRVAVMVGGASAAFDLPPEHAADLADRIAAAVRASGGSLLLTYSRRTPEAAKGAMTARLSALPGWIWDGSGDNPLFAMLDAADHVLVTEDSANMATEAASTGKPVHILPMVARKAPGKFARLHADLRTRGAARPFDGSLTPWTYAPLNETERAARAVLEAMGTR